MPSRSPWTALVAVAVFATALAAGSAAGARAGDLGYFADKALPALVTVVIAVPLLLALWTRGARRPLADVGLNARGALKCFMTGVLVLAGSAVVVFGLATAGGWLVWQGLDWQTVALFLVSNAIIAFCLEALPEELTFRGIAHRALRDRFRAGLAFVGAVVLFLLAPWLSSLIRTALFPLVGMPTPPVRYSPDGDPVSYVIVMSLFGVVFLTARLVTDSLWTSIGAHLTALTIQRITVAGGGFDTGVSVEVTTPDALLLVPVYLVLAGGMFALLGRMRTRRLATVG